MTIKQVKEFNTLFTDCQGKPEADVRLYLSKYNRDTLLEFSAYNDRNGVYTDKQLRAEYGKDCRLNSLALATAYLVETLCGIDIIE